MDYVVSLICIAKTELVARKHWQGWLLGIMNQALWITISLQNELYGLLPLSMYMLARYGLAARSWAERGRCTERHAWTRKRW